MNDNIKAVFEVLAKYNKLTNHDMVKVLEGVEPAKLIEDIGSYYKSIMGLLNHQLLADIGWLRVLGTHVSSLYFVPSLLEHFPSERTPPDKLYWTTLDEYKIVRSEIDSIIERVVNTISPSEYSATIIVEGRRGRFEYIIWRILLHLFNHETHHRGGVSVLLDQFKIENDYSNLLWKV
jgi:uncharacterized damage-inducible protein DinB